MIRVMNTTAPQLAVIGGYTFLGEMKQVVFDLRWMFLFILILITADFILGIIDSIIKRGEEFRFSRAGRRTMCKFIEYNSYLVLGFTFGIAVLQPVGICNYMISSVGGLCLAILFEADSIKDHICAIHGIKNNISIKRLLVAFIKKKYVTAGEIIEEVEKEDNNEKH